LLQVKYADKSGYLFFRSDFIGNVYGGTELFLYFTINERRKTSEEYKPIKPNPGHLSHNNSAGVRISGQAC